MKIRRLCLKIAAAVTALSILLSGMAVFAEIELSGAVNLNEGKRYFNSAMYDNYIYALTTTDQILDVFDMDTHEKVYSVGISYNHSQPFNRYVYVKNKELFALANDGIHRYSLKNPAEPKEIGLYNYRSCDYFEVEGDYIYLPLYNNNGLQSINMNSGESNIISNTKYTGVFYHDGYLYAVNKESVDVYSTQDSLAVPELAAHKSFGATVTGINAIGNTLFMTAWTDSSAVADLWWIDISEPEMLGSKSFNKWVAPGTNNRRLADIDFVNGLMLVPSTDNKMYTFDISKGADDGVVEDVVLLETVSISGNPYRFSMNDSKISFQNTSFMLYDYEVTYMDINDSDVIELPIKIGGKALGQEKVCVEFAGQQKIVSVNDFGTFEAVFDDSTVPNGSYTVNAYSVDNEKAADEKTVNIDAKRLDITANYENGKANINIINYQSSFNAAVILAGYKDNQMTDFDIWEENLSEEAEIEINIKDDEYDFVKVIAARKTDKGYVPVGYKTVYGSDNREPVEANINDNGFDVRCDMNFSTAEVTVNIASLSAKTDILVMAEMPNKGGYEFIDVISLSDKTGTIFIPKAPIAENEPYSVTVSAIGEGEYLYSTGEFTYVGEETINGILGVISKQTDEEEFFGLLKEHSKILNVDLSDSSDFAGLTDKYRTDVFNALSGKDYSKLGSVQLKLDFDEAVAEQTDKKATDIGLEALNKAENTVEFETVLKNNPALKINIEKDGYYSVLSAKAKEKVFDIINVNNYTDREALKADYEIATSLWYINDANYSEFEKRINDSTDITKITLPGECEGFTNVQKTLYYKELAKNDYDSLESLQKALNSNVAPVLSIKSNVKIEISNKFAELSNSTNYYAFAQYEDFVYSVTPSNVVVMDFGKDNPEFVSNPDNEYLKVGTNNNSRINRYIYQEDGYLYVYSMTGMIRRFSLENPANPAYVKDYTYGGGVVSWMDVLDGYLYICAGGRLGVINLETGESKMTSFDLSSFRCDGDYLYGIKSGAINVYSLKNRMNPTLEASKAMTYTSDGKVMNRTPVDIEYLNGYVMITNYGSNASAYDLWLLDVNNPNSLSDSEFIKYKGDDSFKRISYMQIKNGLLFVGDVDARIHVFDVTALPYIEEILEFGTPGINPYLLSVFDNNIYVGTGGAFRKYDYTVNNLELNSADITQRPAVVRGTAAGSGEVSVTLGTMTKTAKVSRDGSFSAEFDDDFLPNGKYSAAASLADGTEKNVEINVNLTPRIRVTENYASGTADIAVKNEVRDFDGLFITCGIKDGALISYSIDSKNVTDGSTMTNTLSDYDKYDTVKSYLLRKTENGVVLVWEGTAHGKAIDTYAVNSIEAGNELNVSADIEHAKKQVVINIASENAVGTALAIVLKPGYNDISDTSIEYIGTADINNSKTAIGFIMNSSEEDIDYSVLASVKGNGKYLYGSDKFKYFGSQTLNPIFEQIKNANDDNIEDVLLQYQDKLSIDLSETSGFASLEEGYQKTVLSAVKGKNYIELGSTQLKNDFNNTVREQTACQAVNNAKDFEELTKAFEMYSVLDININADGYITKLTDESKGKLYIRMHGKGYSDIKKIKEDCVQGSALEYVNQTAYDVLKPVIDEVTKDLSLTFTDKYLTLEKDSLYLSYMMKEIASKDYETRDKLNEAIRNAADYVYNTYYKKDNGSDGSKGSGGTGSGGGGFPAASKGNESTNTEVNNEKKEFKDLDAVKWAETAIYSLSDSGIIAGRSNEVFAPLDNITREEFTKLAVLAFAVPVTESEQSKFTDVSRERWSFDYIIAAYVNGIISGVSETEFAPEEKISRQDMAVILYRVICSKGFKAEEYSAEFTDENEISEYAKEAVNALHRLDIIKGVDENNFAPHANANRAMAAQLIYNCMNYLSK